jgi:hypothetical protein
MPAPKNKSQRYELKEKEGLNVRVRASGLGFQG